MKVPLLVPELATKGMQLMGKMRRLEMQRVPKPRPEKGLDLLM